MNVALFNAKMGKGYRIAKDDPSSSTAERTKENAAALLLVSTDLGGASIARITSAIATVGSGTRVVAALAIIQNAGTESERRIDANRSLKSARVQGGLDQLVVDPAARKMPRS